MLGRMPEFLDHVGLDAVEASGDHCSRRLPDDAEDGDRDEKTDDRVGQRKAEPHTKRTQNHGQTGQPVCAGVIAVGDQRGAVHLATDLDAEDRDRLVADEADHARYCYREKLSDRLRMD